MSQMMNYAYNELKAAGMLVDNPESTDKKYNNMVSESVLKLVETFSEDNHSGFSASMTVNILEKLLRYEPLTPLTGKDEEWMEVGEGVYQNKRCSHVFKQVDRFDGQAYDLDGKVFVDPDGSAWTSRDSCVPITFPYTPKKEYVKREAE